MHVISHPHQKRAVDFCPGHCLYQQRLSCTDMRSLSSFLWQQPVMLNRIIRGSGITKSEMSSFFVFFANFLPFRSAGMSFAICETLGKGLRATGRNISVSTAVWKRANLLTSMEDLRCLTFERYPFLAELGHLSQLTLTFYLYLNDLCP